MLEKETDERVKVSTEEIAKSLRCCEFLCSNRPDFEAYFSEDPNDSTFGCVVHIGFLLEDNKVARVYPMAIHPDYAPWFQLEKNP